MDRMQVYLEAEQRLRLHALARAQGRPAAELVRDAVSRYLETETRAIPEGDGLLALVGAARDLETATDVSQNHHRYLVVAEPKRPTYEGARGALPVKGARKPKSKARRAR